MQRELLNNGAYFDYFDYAGNYVSLPHFQDFPAVKHLVENDLIPDDSVFIPGHTGDLVIGHQISKEYDRGFLTYGEFKKVFFSKFYPGCHDLEFLEKCEAYRVYGMKFDSENMTLDSDEWLSFSDTFNMRERQGKFIVNSVRVYEYFGYEWLIPLWNNVILEYWQRIPFKDRYQRKLYLNLVTDKNTISSTNDNNLYHRLGKLIYKNDLLTYFVQKLKRMWEYKHHPLHIPELFSFPEYAEMNIKVRGYFDFNHLISELYLKHIGVE